MTKKEPTDPNLNLEDMISLGVTYPIEVFSNPATALQLLVDPHNKRLAGSLWTGFYRSTESLGLKAEVHHETTLSCPIASRKLKHS